MLLQVHVFGGFIVFGGERLEIVGSFHLKFWVGNFKFGRVHTYTYFHHSLTLNYERARLHEREEKRFYLCRLRESLVLRRGVWEGDCRFRCVTGTIKGRLLVKSRVHTRAQFFYQCETSFKGPFTLKKGTCFLHYKTFLLCQSHVFASVNGP